MLVEDISNEFLRNKSSPSTDAVTYPKTLAEAYNYLGSYRKDPKNLTRLINQGNNDSLSNSVAFTPGTWQSDNDDGTAERAFATT
mmetsp:Transcript_20810/g.30007  ORF Transcript_20810/g.30007 Transcript_20810/m.30007 type:complete len:85 (-) Transcript_20810:34-288(-)|eukprot:CAMPEP_0202479114 /NCGR_PEP_ID=MMETSP1360-20130828/94812_1 /ASSEMBLY_ACC=CAM_ASM_000848 /TAXON_ID=515479 /ORGANISM="Licmophora paradoxa, Strain CCMP2313" /LENGTH=84 /DNA_ID=CAMNT_0049106425 /DNA_START=155 /DNA_END=409 /DNA_ORIENTATION=+